VAKEASRSHEKLVFLNKLAQQEIGERKRPEAALAEVNSQLEARVAERISATRGDGLGRWYGWLRDQMAEVKT
jgi:hypothetical protein